MKENSEGQGNSKDKYQRMIDLYKKYRNVFKRPTPRPLFGPPSGQPVKYLGTRRLRSREEKWNHLILREFVFKTPERRHRSDQSGVKRSQSASSNSNITLVNATHASFSVVKVDNDILRLRGFVNAADRSLDALEKTLTELDAKVSETSMAARRSLPGAGAMDTGDHGGSSVDSESLLNPRRKRVSLLSSTYKDSSKENVTGDTASPDTTSLEGVRQSTSLEIAPSTGQETSLNTSEQDAADPQTDASANNENKILRENTAMNLSLGNDALLEMLSPIPEERTAENSALRHDFTEPNPESSEILRDARELQC